MTNTFSLLFLFFYFTHGHLFGMMRPWPEVLHPKDQPRDSALEGGRALGLRHCGWAQPETLKLHRPLLLQLWLLFFGTIHFFWTSDSSADLGRDLCRAYQLGPGIAFGTWITRSVHDSRVLDPMVFLMFQRQYRLAAASASPLPSYLDIYRVYIPLSIHTCTYILVHTYVLRYPQNWITSFKRQKIYLQPGLPITLYYVLLLEKSAGLSYAPYVDAVHHDVRLQTKSIMSLVLSIRNSSSIGIEDQVQTQPDEAMMNVKYVDICTYNAASRDR